MDGLSTQEGKQEALHPDESPEKKAKKSRRHSSTRANIPGSVGSNGEQTAQLQLHQQPSSATAAELTQNLLISIAHSGLNISLASTSGAVYSPAANCTGEDAACETSIHSTFVGTPTLTTFNTPIATPLLTPNTALEKADPRSATGHLPGLPSVPEEMACSAELVVEAIVADSAAPVSLSPAPTAQTSASGDSGSAVVTAVPSEEMHKS
ncbi:hypothetical protein GGI12_005360 [Dipsacomyces acuminosporus]|nr:hypothetical protein GGI12_005360 [Dipsacomyces acuminosporus]